MELPPHTHKHRQSKAIINRLSRVEGHVRSIKKMVDDGRDCSDILIQIAAVRSAVNKVGRLVLEDHLESCLFHPGSSVAAEDNEVWLSIKEAFDVYF